MGYEFGLESQPGIFYSLMLTWFGIWLWFIRKEPPKNLIQVTRYIGSALGLFICCLFFNMSILLLSSLTMFGFVKFSFAAYILPFIFALGLILTVSALIVGFRSKPFNANHIIFDLLLLYLILISSVNRDMLQISAHILNLQFPFTSLDTVVVLVLFSSMYSQYAYNWINVKKVYIGIFSLLGVWLFYVFCISLFNLI